MAPMIPYLCVAGVEVVNENRVLEYLRKFGDYRINVGEGCGCGALDDLDSAYTGPADDPAPWYESTRSESADFLGIITDQLSIENPPIRTVAALAHGGLIGTLQRRSRLVVVHGQMFASSAQGMAWGERWLTEALTGSLCEDCGGDDAEILPACVEGFNAPGAFRTLYDVGIVDGPLFTPVQGVPGCVVQEVAFQLAAGNPYLHHPTETAAVTIGTGQTLSQVIETEEWGGDAAVSVQISAATNLTDVVVRASPLVSEGDCGNANLNPCVEYTVDTLPSGRILRIDGIRRRVTEFNDSLKSTQSGYRRLVFDGAFKWIEVPPCSLMCVTVSVGSGTADVEIAWAVREV